MHKPTYLLVLFLLPVILLSLACATGSTRRVGVDDTSVNDPTSTEVQDYRTVAERMARSLIQTRFVQDALEPPTVAFLSVENRTNDYIDTEAFLEKIRTLLVKHSGGKITFLDRQATLAILKERKAKELGQVTASGKFEESRLGADYFLTGVIHSINRGQGSRMTVYRRYSFRLTDADTSAIVWEDEYETKILRQRDWRDW